MPSEFPVTKIIQFAEISQYRAGNDKSSIRQLQSGTFIGILPKLLYMEGTLLQNLNSLNPGISTLRGTAEYVLSLCGKYALQAQNILNSISGGLATITGPSNQSILVGQSASFTIVVTSATSYTIQWLRNGVVIPGATSLTYMLSNAQLTDTGAQFSAVVTNGAGPSSSGTGLLTVTQSIQGFLYYSSSDPGPTLLSNSDPFSYQINYSITHNSPISIPLTVAAANNVFEVIKVPSTENAYHTWFNTNLNQGVIPPPADFVFAPPVTFGEFTYYYTKQLVSMDSTQPLILS